MSGPASLAIVDLDAMPFEVDIANIRMRELGPPHGGKGQHL
ncbi:MAG: hypothetical protein V1694_01230 [Candidatus Eisenbacteria bacterium]